MSNKEMYRIVDDETGARLHESFPRSGAVLWAARWCDDHGYNQINIDDESNVISVSIGKHVSRR